MTDAIDQRGGGGRVEGPHRLLAELGRGGMGTVYLALAQGPAGFNKLKVVKHLLADLAEDTHFVNMFMDEARLSARLNHPNIVQTNEVGFDGRRYFIEMEYLEGVTLEVLQRRAIAKTGSFPRELGLYILAQSLAGLHYAHELVDHDGKPLEIVHRDVSPQNIFITYEGAVKVLDFGIAKATDSSVQTRTGDLKGKVKYMAPEQAARGKAKVTRRADLFAMGVILWQLLTGKRLYDGLADEEILLALRSSTIPRPKSIRADVPDALDELCANALAPNADDRIATAEKFQSAIEEYLTSTGQPVGARQLATLVATLFADRRAAVRSEIDAQIRAMSSVDRTSGSLPLLAHAPAIRATETGASRVTMDAPSRAQSLADKVLEANALMRRGARVRRVLIAAVIASAAALAIVLARHRSDAQHAHAIDPTVRCATRADCVEAGLRGPWICGAAGTCARSPGCTTNAECTKTTGQAALCNRDGRCTSFATEDCHVLAEPGNVADDETLWFGVIMPQARDDKPIDPSMQAITNAIDLARRDFMSSTNGLPSSHLGRMPRPIGLLACDDTDLTRSSKHLIEDIHVPAIIGFGGPKELVTIAPSLFANDVLAIETNSSNALITSVPGPAGQPRLLWRTTGSAANEGKPLAAVVEQLIEPRVRAQTHAKETPRIALVRRQNPASLSIAESFITELRVNRKSIADEMSAFRQYVYQPGEEASIVDQLADFRPSVIVAINTGFAETIATPLEAKWPRDVARPYYLFDGTLGSDAFRFLGHDPSRRHRYFSVDFPANTETNLKFALRYNEFYSPKITPGTAPGVVYDALFVLVYAAAALPDEPVTGLSISRGIAKLIPPGIPIDVGGAAAHRAFAALRSGQNIDLNGAGTPLDFDRASGETQADYVVYCAHVDAKGNVDDAMESGVRASAGKPRLEGELRCP